MSEPMRLQKWLATAGLCSRREGDKWISDGRVSVNKVIITLLGTKVDMDDEVRVDGRLIPPPHDPLVILVLNKPPGVLCTRKDPKNRPNVFDLLDSTPAIVNAMASAGVTSSRLINVGRLDYNSEGLILFTNDGDIAHQLMHPSSQVSRTYRVRVHGRVDAIMLEKLRAGVILDDGPTGPLQMDLDCVPGANSWLTLTLTEGRNRMVRRIFETVDMAVSRLIRIAYGNFTLGDLPRGAWRALQQEEVVRLLAPLKGVKRPLFFAVDTVTGKKPAPRKFSPRKPVLDKPPTRRSRTERGRSHKTP